MKKNIRIILSIILLITSATLYFTNISNKKTVNALNVSIAVLEEQLVKSQSELHSNKEVNDLRNKLNLEFIEFIKLLDKGDFQAVKSMSTSNIDIVNEKIAVLEPVGSDIDVPHIIELPPGYFLFNQLSFGTDKNMCWTGYSIKIRKGYPQNDSDRSDTIDLMFKKENDVWKIHNIIIKCFHNGYGPS